jgi:hypothetical protein
MLKTIASAGRTVACKERFTEANQLQKVIILFGKSCEIPALQRVECRRPA